LSITFNKLITDHYKSPVEAVLSLKCNKTDFNHSCPKCNSDKIPGIQDGFNERNGSHRPITAEVRGEEEEPEVDWQQVVEGELA